MKKAFVVSVAAFGAVLIWPEIASSGPSPGLGSSAALVEGVYCTSESVLNDFFGVELIIGNKEYPFISSSK